MAQVAVASDQRRFCIGCVLLVVLMLSLSRTGTAQAVSGSSNPFSPESVNRYPGLLPELGRLLDRLQNNVTFPPERADSRLLPLLPSSTVGYLALPNYGGVARQAL